MPFVDKLRAPAIVRILEISRSCDRILYWLLISREEGTPLAKRIAQLHAKCVEGEP
jgi:hypothetical protein